MRKGKTIAGAAEDLYPNLAADVAQNFAKKDKMVVMVKMSVPLAGSNTPNGVKAGYTKVVGVGVSKLADATAIGQRVRGTSPDSVYIVTAVSPTVRLAMRTKNGQLSVRAEGTPTNGEITSMKKFGLTEGSSSEGSYWSMHMSLGGVPVARVIGAVLMGLGIDFMQVMTNPKGVINADN
jgi:hypothetical protein